MSKLRVMTIFGTRPDAIKMAPLISELKGRSNIDCQCCVTAQHRQMLDSVLDTFGIVPDFDLDIMRHGQTLTEIMARSLTGLDGVFARERPDLVLVHGDTSTSLAGALAAFYHRIPVGHVEAGLRTWDKFSPFPEEMNRQMTARIAALHFCPTDTNAANLRAEGIVDGIHVTGNTVIDAMKTTVRADYTFQTPLLNTLDYEKKQVILVTCHRRENYGRPMDDIMAALSRIARDFPAVELVYPVHLSQEVQRAAATLAPLPNIHRIAPLETVELHNLEARCYMVMTDSGGLQEEAPALGKPVLVLRRETERPEAVQAGTVKLAGTGQEDIYRMACDLLSSPDSYAKMAHAVNPYGDGNACPRIADAIEQRFL